MMDLIQQQAIINNMKEFWNQRFIENEYIYGKEPNSFLKACLENAAIGTILFPAEGEGRNAVYAAKRGWKVYAYDFSEAARNKALQLAKENQVALEYMITSHEEANYPEQYFDAIGLFYAHTPFRQTLHHNVLKWLKPGGVIWLEGFSKEQLNYSSGGPKEEQLLFSEEIIRNDFMGASQSQIRKEEIMLNEGKYHQGKASVIRAIIKK
jgi:2-polyprenyl-3-methyl-5-hydroxy-6-metoxy-1,4-benzoquinol methylase